MEFHELAHYLEIWNKWIVFPALAIATLIFHIRKQKTSTRLIFIGLLLFVVGDLVASVYKSNPLHPVYIACMVSVAIGWVIGIAGSVLYWRKDYVPQSKNT